MHLQSFSPNSNLSSLSNVCLHEKICKLAEAERKLTRELLEHLREVERRRLYAERGFGSLFEYVVTELRYSESAAQRRIFAMRALRELPELGEKIESGELKVTQLAQTQSFFRAEAKSGKRYTVSEKKALIESTLGKSTRETEKILADKNPEYFERDRVRVVTETKSQVTFLADESLLRDLQAVRDRFAHELPAGASLAEVISFLAKKTLASAVEHQAGRAPSAKLPAVRKSSVKESPAVQTPISLPAPVVAAGPTTTPSSPSLKPARASSHSRFVPIFVKRAVWRRDEGKCAFISPVTGRKCDSRHRLQVDHVYPFALGGSSREASNLRLLCFAHNQFAARAFGRNPISR